MAVREIFDAAKPVLDFGSISTVVLARLAWVPQITGLPGWAGSPTDSTTRI